MTVVIRGGAELSETQESGVASGVQTGRGEVGEASGEGCGAGHAGCRATVDRLWLPVFILRVLENRPMILSRKGVVCVSRRFPPHKHKLDTD